MSNYDSILRFKQVQARVYLSKATVYAWIKEGKFPRPRLLGPNSVGWLESEISAWIASRPAANL